MSTRAPLFREFGGLSHHKISGVLRGKSDAEILEWRNQHASETTAREFRIGLVDALDMDRLRRFPIEALSLPNKEYERFRKVIGIAAHGIENSDANYRAVNAWQNAETTVYWVRNGATATAGVVGAAIAIPAVAAGVGLTTAGAAVAGTIAGIGTAGAHLAGKMSENATRGNALNQGMGKWDAAEAAMALLPAGIGKATNLFKGLRGVAPAAQELFSNSRGFMFGLKEAWHPIQQALQNGSRGKAFLKFGTTLANAGVFSNLAYNSGMTEARAGATPPSLKQATEKTVSALSLQMRSVPRILGKAPNVKQISKLGTAVIHKASAYGERSKSRGLTFYNELRKHHSDIQVGFIAGQSTQLIKKGERYVLNVPAHLSEKWEKYHQQVINRFDHIRTQNHSLSAEQALVAARMKTQAPAV